MDISLSNIQEALQLKSNALQTIIIEVLKKRPNQSCVKDKLHTFILKEFGIVTRGTPRKSLPVK